MAFRDRLCELVGPDRGAATRLSEAVGASRGLVQSWIKGEKKPSMDYIIALAKYFSVTTDYLLGVSLENNSESSAAISENGQEMLKYFEQLPDGDQQRLIGQAQGILMARGKTAEAPASCEPAG